MRKSISTLVFILGLNFLCTPLTTTAQETQSKPEPPRSPQTQVERNWLSALPHVHAATKSRNREIRDSIARLRRGCKLLKSSDGVDEFVDQVLGLYSKQLMLTDSAKHRAWIKQQYLKHVFSLDDAKTLVRNELKNINRLFESIDNDLIVAIGTDIELDPATLPAREPTFAAIEVELDRMTDIVIKHVYEASGKQIGRFAAGAIGGFVGEKWMRESLKDENGESTIGDNIVSGIFGFVSSIVAEKVSDEILQTDATLKKQVNGLTDQLINAIVGETTINKCIADQYHKMSADHTSEVLVHVIRSLGLDPQWALSNL